MNKIRIIPAPIPEPVAYANDLAVYIVGDKERGGGCWVFSNGGFVPATFTRDLFEGSSRYTSLYAGTVLEIQHDVKTVTL